MGLRMLGDSAWLFEAGGDDPHGRLKLVLRLAQLLEDEAIPEVLDVVSSFDSVAVHFDPSNGERVLAWLTSLPVPAQGTTEPGHARTIDVPVVYGGDSGPDLKAIAANKGRSEKEIVALHTAHSYMVAAVGFSPGFPYLLGLPEELHEPRRASPRPVEAGAVAIAGGQAGIYPFASQGGWHVLGRTDLRLFDPNRTNPALLKPGDQVRFVPVESLVFPSETPATSACSRGGVEVVEPGALTTVQDLGRPGFQAVGVSPGGAVDHVAARVANRLVGNPDDAALLECCMTGPLLKFHETARVAWLGWADTRSGQPVEVKVGGELDLRGRMRALRGYVAVAGGLNVPLAMGSRATDVRAGFGGCGGRVLATGDRLAIGHPLASPPPGAWRVAWPQADLGMIELRFLRGMQAEWFDRDSRETFRNAIYQVSPVSDRTGTRLDGPQLYLEETRDMVSQPVVAGSVQVPPDGQPIILMAERQTIGGYPQIGHVISADLPKLARTWPGARLRFREVTLEEARDAWSHLQRELGLLRAGLDFLR